MIDIHFHCLPGIDDGPGDWDEAIALCRAAEAEGTTHIVATPHVMRDPWINDSVAVRDALVDELNRRLGGHPVILPGCEYFFSADAVELWEAGTIIGLNRTNYLLVEFPAHEVPRNAEAVFHELIVGGVTPIIAHPERNVVFANDLARLERFVSKGAMTQLTAASVTGDFGRNPTRAAKAMLEAGLAHFVASDAHDVRRRAPMMLKAIEMLSESASTLSVAAGQRAGAPRVHDLRAL